MVREVRPVPAAQGYRLGELFAQSLFALFADFEMRDQIRNSYRFVLSTQLAN
jgi:hypothetical protein